jgi:hypothetical protein
MAVDATSNEHVLDDPNNVLLLVARQLADLLKDTPRLADRSTASLLGRCLSQEMFDRDVQHFCQLRDVFWAQSRRSTFPTRVRLLGDAEFFGDLLLRKTEGLSRGRQPFSKWRPFKFCRASCNHAISIRVVRKRYRKSLHDLQVIE